MPYFGQDLFLKAEARGPLTEPEYLEALEANRQLSRKEGIDAVMDRHKLDALVAPTGGPAWMTDLANGGGGQGGSSTPAAVAGYPNLTVPAGFVFGLPVGVSFFGRVFDPRLDVPQDRPRLRAGDQGAQAAVVLADGGPTAVGGGRARYNPGKSPAPDPAPDAA